MVKRILQDVLPSKKTIRHIVLDNGRGRSTTIEPTSPAPERKIIRKKINFRRGFKIFLGYSGALAVIVVVCAGIYFGSKFFSSAVVTIWPKNAEATVDLSLKTSEQLKDQSLEGDVAFNRVIASSTVSETVVAREEKNVQRKAGGRIVVFNNFSSTSQRLIKNTRFQSSDGRIYRIDSSIDVPGKTVINGKATPGSIEVAVYADATGEEFNMKLSDLKGDFSIPGFKGTARYDSFYARQKTDIVGGFDGMAKVVSDSDATDVGKKMTEKLKQELWNTIKNGVTNKMFVSPDAFKVEYSDITRTPTKEGERFELSGRAVALVFDRSDLGMVVADKTFSDYDGYPVIIKNLDDMTFKLLSENSQSLFTEKNIVVTLSGEAVFVWYYDEKALSSDLAGKTKRETAEIMSNYPAVLKAESVIKPFWTNRYPKNDSNIKINPVLD